VPVDLPDFGSFFSRCGVIFGFTRLTAWTKLATRHLILGLAFFSGNSFRHDASERSMRAAKKPTEPKRNGHRGIGLRLDRVAQRAFQRANRLLSRVIGAIGKIGGSLARVSIDIARRVRGLAGEIASLLFYFAKPLIDVRASGTGLSHDTPLHGVPSLGGNAQPTAKVRGSSTFQRKYLQA
jgi:hypothetical protein